jgi:uncharacterized membrane protein/PAS domain-containing protein
MPRLRLDDTRLDELPVPSSGQIDYWDPVLPGFGLRVSQGGTRAWVMMVREAGRKHRITLGAYPTLSLAEARAKCHARLGSAAASRDSRAPRTGGRWMGAGHDRVGLPSGPGEGGPGIAWFLDRAPTPFLIIEGGLIQRANAAAATLLGADEPGALLGRVLLDFIHPIDRPAFIRRQGGPVASSPDMETPPELRLVRLDGLAIPLAVSIAPLSDAPAGALALFMTDLSKRERAAVGPPRGPASRAERRFAKTNHAVGRRSLAKTITWYITGSLNTFAVASIITGQIEFGAFIAFADVITKTLLYYLHERAWAHVQWGLEAE